MQDNHIFRVGNYNQFIFGLPYHMYQQCWILRTGGKGLKRTQVYPKGFGEKICSLHEATMVQLAGFLSTINPIFTPCAAARYRRHAPCRPKSEWLATSYKKKVSNQSGHQDVELKVKSLYPQKYIEREPSYL